MNRAHRMIGLGFSVALLTATLHVASIAAGNANDPAWTGKNASVFNPPSDPAKWPAWREGLIDWRAKELRTYSNANYLKPGYQWVPSCYSSCFFIIQDSLFYNRQTGEYNVEGFLDYYEREYGGLDAVIMWQLSPQIGFDNRNQFDFFRNMPGGLPGLKKVVARFHARGVKFFVNHNPSNAAFFKNENLRPETPTDPGGGPEAIAQIVRATDADGVFLNTYAIGGDALQAALDKIRPGIAIEGEHDIKSADHVAKQHMEWFQQQWGELTYVPGAVIRNKWLEPRHMMHQTRRASYDHANELHMAWMNGSGMTIWEDVFGIWRGWSPRDRSMLRSMRPVLRRYSDLFCGEGWTPMVPTLQKDVYANLWEKDGVRLWTVINNSASPIQGDLLPVDGKAGDRYFDLIAGKEVTAKAANASVTLPGTIAAKGVAAFLAAPANKLGKDLDAFLASQAAIQAKASTDTTYPALKVTLKPVTPTRKYAAKDVPAGMVALAGSKYSQNVSVTRRECGAYNNRDYNLALKTTRNVEIAALAVDTAPVTNAQFKKFMDAAHYAPKAKENFLKAWVDGAPAAGTQDDPVVYVDIDDAREYARWAGKRLPTEEEWQYALESEKVHYGTKRVWEWNESERNDTRVRFCMLKGGSDWKATGSIFYAPGGPQLPDYAAKYMFTWPGLDRLSTIGFRCAVDVE